MLHATTPESNDAFDMEGDAAELVCECGFRSDSDTMLDHLAANIEEADNG